jgi:hypothetical protein
MYYRVSTGGHGYVFQSRYKTTLIQYTYPRIVIAYVFKGNKNKRPRKRYHHNTKKRLSAEGDKGGDSHTYMHRPLFF